MYALYITVLSTSSISQNYNDICTCTTLPYELAKNIKIQHGLFMIQLAYRQQLVSMQHKEWSKINASLFPLCFSSSGHHSLQSFQYFRPWCMTSMRKIRTRYHSERVHAVARICSAGFLQCRQGPVSTRFIVMG